MKGHALARAVERALAPPTHILLQPVEGQDGMVTVCGTTITEDEFIAGGEKCPVCWYPETQLRRRR